MCLRGAAILQLARGGAAAAECPFPHSEQGRRKVGGDLAPAETGLGERPGEGRSLTFQSLSPSHASLQRLGAGKAKVHPGSLKRHSRSPRRNPESEEGLGPGAQTASPSPPKPPPTHTQEPGCSSCP